MVQPRLWRLYGLSKSSTGLWLKMGMELICRMKMYPLAEKPNIPHTQPMVRKKT